MGYVATFLELCARLQTGRLRISALSHRIYVGYFPKVDDATVYKTPVDTEALGVVRTERDFAHEIAYALSDQGLDLYSAAIRYDDKGGKELFLRIVNNRYRGKGLFGTGCSIGLNDDTIDSNQRVSAAAHAAPCPEQPFPPDTDY